MSGNCATGRAVRAMMPAIEMTVETTNASRGRRMKTEEMVMGSPARHGRRGRRRARRDGHALAHPLLALDDHLLAGLQALLDGKQAVARRAGLDPALLGHVLVVDHEDVGAA